MSLPLCIHCGSEIPSSRIHATKFCSPECRFEYYGPRHKACANCGTIFTPIKHSNHRGKSRWAWNKYAKTCSSKCHKELCSNEPERKRKIGEATRGSKHHNWQGGKSVINLSDHRGSGWIHIAEAVRNRDKRVCRICGKSELENGRRMDVHHIVPYHDLNDTKKANRMSNLISLCQSCHKKEESKLQFQQIMLPFAIIAQADRRAAITAN